MRLTRRAQLQKILLLLIYRGKRMKISDQFTSPASFLKKQSHIITNNVTQDFYPNTPTLPFREKQMHRSHFHSQVNSNKYIESLPYFDEHDSEVCSQDKEKGNDEESMNNNNPQQVSQHPYDSFYQSQDVSSEQSGTKSQKKIGYGSIFREHPLKKVSSNCSNKGDGKFLFINSKKQKHNNNCLFQDSADTLREEIKKYEISIDKLKEENLKLRSQKVKMSSSNDSMQLIQLRLELQALKKKIKQLETEKQMHLTINSDKDLFPMNSPGPIQPEHKQSSRQDFGSISQSLTANQKGETEKKHAPAFRAYEGQESPGRHHLNSPRAPRDQGSGQNYRILQNMKSPYFLKKT